MAFIKKPDNASIRSAALHMEPSTTADRAAAAQVGGGGDRRPLDRSCHPSAKCPWRLHRMNVPTAIHFDGGVSR